MTSEESLEAHDAIVATGQEATQVRRILQHLRDHGAGTAQEVAAATGLTNQTVTRRRSLLLRTGLAREQLPRRCKVTGYQAKPLQVTEEGRGVADGADVPDTQPSRRDLELRALEAARDIAKVWASVPGPPAAMQRLLDRVWALDHFEDRHRAGVNAIREPWGSPRRAPLAETGVWLRRNGDEVPIAEMNDHHLKSAIEWCQENDADPAAAPLGYLLLEAGTRGHATVEASLG